MKNVDVPMWDKGDNTDDFSKGGAKRKGFNFKESTTEKTKKVEKVFKKVLGRKPSSKELSYYKYSTVKEEDLTIKLLESDEFQKNLEKLKEYPDLQETLRTAKMSVMKLKNKLRDQEKEFMELASLLKEKNRIIQGLRTKKSSFLTDENLFRKDRRDTFTQISTESSERDEIKPVKLPFKGDGLLVKIFDLFRK